MIQDLKPLVSIITPVYNGANFLDDLIRSVLQQDYPNIEHIIIDDGSTDNHATANVLRQYEHLRWWTRENRGQYATMNEGLKAASGDIVIFICADDLMLPGAVSSAINYFSSRPHCDCIYGNYTFINSDGMALKHVQPMRVFPTTCYPYSFHIAHSSLYVRRKVLLENNLFFNEALKYVGDYEWIVRLIRSGLQITKIRDNFSAIRLHWSQTSKVSFYNMRRESLLIQKNFKISLVGVWFFRKAMFFSEMLNIVRDDGVKQMLVVFMQRIRSVLRINENNPS